ncbi:MAG: ferrous iron transport protein B [Spirochaetia bacterium]|jgi:ferrous iron transport protein B|nr:ferrous iron transport protein B [Spirochaetia bacterium]
MKTLALIGNPNCGKTTLFNQLTGTTAHVGNWPGVTVEEKDGLWRGHKVVDLPGIYSLSPYSPEEKLSRRFILDQKPDIVVDVIDATNLERSLYLTSQLSELARPMILVLNMQDLLEKEGIKLDEKQLSQMFGTPVVSISASKGIGLDGFTKVAEKLLADPHAPSCPIFAPPVETCITRLIEDDYLHTIPVGYPPRWCAIKLLERDELFRTHMPPVPERLHKVLDRERTELEKVFNDDIEAIIIDQRYHVAERVSKACQIKLKSEDRFTLDTILTNRILAIPLFILIMAGVFFLSIGIVGGATVPLFEKGILVLRQSLTTWFAQLGVLPFLSHMLVDGIIAGCGSVLSFVPQLIVLFALLSILEDCGYMARIAFIMDRMMRDLGLSGKSIIPLVIGTGCSVPAIMSSRTIEHPKMRRLTIAVTPFIPCSAKLPIFSLMITYFFNNAWYMAPLMYFTGILAIMLTGILAQALDTHKENNAFIMELPRYQVPTLKNTAIQTWDRTKGFLLKAGTTILLASVVIWLLQTYSFSFMEVEAEKSMLSQIGKFIAPIFKPLGFGKWQLSVALLTGIAAKESIVSTLSVTMQGQPFSLLLTPASALSYMLFILLASPCIASLSAMASELEDRKLFFLTILWQTGLAYIVSLVVYTIAKGVF